MNKLTFNIFNNNNAVSIMDGRLSWGLLPLSLYIIIFKSEFVKYFSYIFISIALIGSIETYVFFTKYYKDNLITTSIICVLSWIFHLVLLYPFSDVKKYMSKHIINYFWGIIGIFIGLYLPYWPYLISRETFITYLIIIYGILSLLY